MTRMLCSLLVALACVLTLGSCSLFDSDERVGPGDPDTATSETGVLDAEDELLAESDNLAQSGSEEAASGESEGESFSDSSDEDADESVAAAEESLDEELSDSELDEKPSNTNASQVDQNLAENELDDLDEEGDTAAPGAKVADADLEDDGNFLDADVKEKDEFALDAEPPATETLTAPPGTSGSPSDFVTAPVVSSSSYNNEVTNLEYKAFENGGTVVIETASPASYQVNEDPNLNQVIISLDGVGLPERFKRPYITKDFRQDIATINGYTDEGTGAARFVIQLKRPIKPVIQKEGSSILVMTGSGSPMVAQSSEGSMDQLSAQNSLDVQAAGDSEIRIEDQVYSMNDPNNSSLKSAFGNVDKSGVQLNNGKFTGDKINVEYTDTDIRTIIDMIADRSGVNLIMDDEVEGRTSVRLRNVPWDQALLVTLRSKGLGYVKQGNVLRIAKQQTLSNEAQAISNQIKSEREAQLLSGGIKVKYIAVSYANVNELATKLKDFKSKEGQIAFDDRTSSLVITDYGEYIERIEELVKALDTAPMQVEIAAKLVEAREQFIREAGINWDIGGADMAMGAQTGRIQSALGGGGANPAQGFTLDLTFGTFDILGDLSAALSLYENQNKIKVLSQPRIVTMNKIKASIEQTTQIPIETVITQPNQPPQITYTFQDLKLSLGVTPQITFKGDVILEVELRREFPGSEAKNGQRELNKRLAKTTVMVKNGLTAVIGGIYQMDDTDIDRGIPVLKDIPLIGYLFKQISVEKSKNELLLFLKPKVLKETEGTMVSTVAPAASFDPFEELSVDEGANKTTNDDADDEAFKESDVEEEETETL